MWIVEGEKDVHALEGLGLTATTCPGGAKKWRGEYGEALRDAQVVIVADRDEPGREHAAAVRAALDSVAGSVRVVEAAAGKDAADHVAAGHRVAEFVTCSGYEAFASSSTSSSTYSGNGNGSGPQPAASRLRFTCAADVVPQATRWLWDQYIPLGELSLLAGREGLGKSTATADLIARVTRGTLAGEFHGSPRGVAIAAHEDSLSKTIVPRLIAAGADLTRVHQVDVVTSDHKVAPLSIPADNAELEDGLADPDVVWLVLDPLVSRLRKTTDTHRDAETRTLLEPLAEIAQRTRTAMTGLMHVNKGTSRDPLTTVMASRAFVAVARAVLYALADPDAEEPGTFLLGNPKSNLGPANVGTWPYTIRGIKVGEDPEDGKPITASAVTWGECRSTTIADALESSYDDPDTRTAVDDAMDWLRWYLAEHGGRATSAEITKAGGTQKHSARTLARARKKLGYGWERDGFQGETYWTNGL